MPSLEGAGICVGFGVFHQLLALNSYHPPLMRRAACDERPEHRRSVALPTENLPCEKDSIDLFSQRKEVKVQCSGLLGMDMNLETPKFLLPSETE